MRMKTFNPISMLKDTAVQFVTSTVYLAKHLWVILISLVLIGLFLKGWASLIAAPILCILLVHITQYTLDGTIKATPLFGFRWRKIETHFLIYTVISYGVLVLLNRLPEYMAEKFSADSGIAVVVGLPILSVLLTLFLSSRLLLVFPLIIKGGTLGIKESWKETEAIWCKTFFLAALFYGIVIGLIIFIKSPYVETLAAIFQAMLAANVYKKIK